MAEQKPSLIFVLVSLRSLFNVGSIFRTADALGAQELYLCGFTGTPLQSKVAKTALGAEQRVAWKKVASVSKLITELRARGYDIVGLETGEDSLDYRQWNPGKRTAILLGNEERGLSDRVKKQCDTIVNLPMHGIKESLNVSVSAGAIGYYWLYRNN